MVGVGIVDGLRRLLGVCGSVQLFFLLLDEGALTRPMTFVSTVNAAVGHFMLSAGIFPSTPIGVTSVAPPSSVFVRPGVARFITGECVYDLWGLRLVGLVRPQPFLVPHPLLIDLFKTSPLALVRDAVFLYYLEEPVDCLHLVALEVLSTWPDAQSRDYGFDDCFLSHLRCPRAKPDETVQILLQCGSFLLQVVEVS